MQPPPPSFALHALLGCEPDRTDDGVSVLVREALGVEVAGPYGLEPVDYLSGSPATGALLRLRGTDTAGASWSLFCKVLQHVRHWPVLAFLPPEHAQHFVEQFPWRIALELWDDAVQQNLPDGLRAPALHRVIELDDDRAAVWTEDVAHEHTPWDDALFARAARLLGRWNARSTAAEVLATSALPAGYALRMYVERSVPLRGLAPLDDDGLWAHPWLAGHTDLRSGLRAVAPGLPEMLDRLDTHVQTLPHGDASPQNLLVPADGSDGFVVIDISFRSPHALGFDLSQLLVGLTHAGVVPAARMPQIAEVVEQAYLDGLHDEDVTDQDDRVRDAFATTALLRSGFDGLRYEPLPLPGADPAPGARDSFDERVAMSRVLLERYRALHPA